MDEHISFERMQSTHTVESLLQYELMFCKTTLNAISDATCAQAFNTQR